MSAYTIGYDEKYKCPFCDKFFDDIDILITNSWKCPECNEYIHIAAPKLGAGHTLIRKKVSELEEYDLVHLPGSQEIYMVIDITKNDKDRVRIALKNYGSRTFKPTDFVTVVTGGYYDYHWKDE